MEIEKLNELRKTAEELDKLTALCDKYGINKLFICTQVANGSGGVTYNRISYEDEKVQDQLGAMMLNHLNNKRTELRKIIEDA